MVKIILFDSRNTGAGIADLYHQLFRRIGITIDGKRNLAVVGIGNGVIQQQRYYFSQQFAIAQIGLINIQLVVIKQGKPF